MKLSTKSKNGGKDFEYKLCPEGAHAAQIVAVVDLGTHTPLKGYQGKPPQPTRKLYVVWQVTDEATRPLIGKDFTASLNEKATLRKWIEALGKKFGDDEEFDPIAGIIGKKCVLTVEHTKNGDKTYHNATNISRPTKGQVIPDADVPVFTFDLDDGEPFRGPVWDLPYWYSRPIEDVIADCEEMRGKPDADLMGDDDDRDEPMPEDEVPF